MLFLGTMLHSPLTEAVEPGQLSWQNYDKEVPQEHYLLLSKLWQFKSKTHNGFVLYCNNHLSGTYVLAGRKYYLIKISSDCLEKKEILASLFFLSAFLETWHLTISCVMRYKTIPTVFFLCKLQIEQNLYDSNNLSKQDNWANQARGKISKACFAFSFLHLLARAIIVILLGWKQPINMEKIYLVLI